MTERRPHWSNDLIVAVGDAIEHAEPTVYPTVGMVNAVIAAVEDWQDRQIIGCRYACLGSQGMEIAKRDFVIARVREVCDRADNNGEWPGMLVRVSAVRKALEGDSDD